MPCSRMSTVYPVHVANREFREEEMKTKQKCSRGGAHGGCIQDLDFLKSCLLRVYDVDLLGGFSRLFTTHFELRGRQQRILPPFAETCSSSSSVPIPKSRPVTARQAAARLEVACRFFCFLRDEHLSIDRPVCPFLAWPDGSCCCGFVCDTAAIRLAATL